MNVTSRFARFGRMESKALVLAAAVAACTATNALASIQTYTLEGPENYGSDILRVIVDVDDNTAGLLSFTVTVSPTLAFPNVGDLYGVFLEFSPHPVLSAADFDGADITAVAFNTINAGGGNNLSGDIATLVPGGTFDVALTIGDGGSSSGLILSTTFTLDDGGGTIDLADLIGVGIRAQTVGPPPDGGGGSSKGFADMYSDTPPPVVNEDLPEPAALVAWVGLTSLAAAWCVRKRRLAG